MKKAAVKMALLWALSAVLILALGGCQALEGFLFPKQAAPPPAANGSGAGILLQGEDILHLLDCDPDELAVIFGEEVESPLYGSDCELGGLRFHFRNNTVVQIDVPDAAMLTKDGSPLNAGRDGIEALLGEPYSVSEMEDLGDTFAAFYEYAGFSLNLYSRQPEGDQWYASVSPNSLPLGDEPE